MCVCVCVCSFLCLCVSSSMWSTSSRTRCVRWETPCKASSSTVDSTRLSVPFPSSVPVPPKSDPRSAQTVGRAPECSPWPRSQDEASTAGNIQLTPGPKPQADCNTQQKKTYRCHNAQIPCVHKFYLNIKYCTEAPTNQPGWVDRQCPYLSFYDL